MADEPEAREPADLVMEERFYGSVTIGERGQVVIPAALRRDCGLKPGDRLLAFRHGPGAGAMILAKIDALHRFLSEQLAHVEGELRRPSPDEGPVEGDEGTLQDGGGEA
jgi:AbrB family looped-hinge helix DNA binding protein